MVGSCVGAREWADKEGASPVLFLFRTRKDLRLFLRECVSVVVGPVPECAMRRYGWYESV